MPDAPDPPRKVYGFKPREFDRANAARPEGPASFIQPSPDPGVSPARAPDEKINIHDLVRAGAGKVPPLGTNAPANRPNEVHGILRDKAARDVAAGDYALGELDDSKRRRRIRNYWIVLAAVDLPLGALAVKIGPHGMAQAFVFPFLIAAMAVVTTVMTWKTFFLRTHY